MAQFTAAEAAKMMDQAVLQGKANLNLVKKCLDVYSKTVYRGRAMVTDEFRLGGRVSAWFTASHMFTKEKFLSSLDMLRLAVPIMYADGQEEVVWQWLGLLYSGELGGSDCQQQSHPDDKTKPLRSVLRETNLTLLMIREALGRGELDAAILQFINACAYMQSTGRMSTNVRSSQLWRTTTRAITMQILRKQYQHGLSADVFDRFLEYRSSWSSSNTFAFELVSLYHPIRPSAEALVIALGQAKDQLEAQFCYMKSMSAGVQRVMSNSLLDGAQLLLEQNPGSVKQAQLVLDLVENQFPHLGRGQGDGVNARKRIESVRQTIHLRIFPVSSVSLV